MLSLGSGLASMYAIDDPIRTPSKGLEITFVALGRVLVADDRGQLDVFDAYRAEVCVYKSAVLKADEVRGAAKRQCCACLASSSSDDYRFLRRRLPRPLKEGEKLVQRLLVSLMAKLEADELLQPAVEQNDRVRLTLVE